MRRLALFLLLPLCAPAPGRAADPAPPHVGMVAAAAPLAAQAGVEILRQGGNAVDAAIAVQAMLSLVEPQSSGLGGGAYLLFHDATTGATEDWDGRETAPAAVSADLFLHPDGTPMGYREAAVGGRAVGVPGAIRMLEALHRKHGHLPWADLFAPAIAQAEAGFPVPARLAGEIADDAIRLGRTPATRALFFTPGGAPLPEGTLLVNPALADALRAIAAGGADALLRGPIAAEIATAIRTDPSPGLMTTDDLAAYAPREGPPVCLPYHQWRVCGPAPSSSGGIAVLETLGALAPFDMARRDPAAPSTAMLILEAERLAFADRDRYVADPDFSPVPVAGLLDPAYLAGRSRLIDPDHALADPPAGQPPGAQPLATAATQPEHGTSDVAIVDADGNAVAMTTTIEDAFGARLLVHGFLLNNELTDFTFRPQVGDRLVANRVEPGKRPRSSMAPSLVFDQQGHLRAIVGSAGGSRIIGYVAQTLVALLDWHMSPAQALSLPHIGARGPLAEAELGTPATALLPELARRGEPLHLVTMNSGTQAIVITDHGPVGAADPRRDGAALAE